MNEVTNKPDLDSFYTKHEGIEICKICGEHNRDHLDNCVALFFKNVEVVLHYYHWVGDYQDWLRSEIDCSLEDKKSLLKKINSAFDNTDTPRKMLKDSALSEEKYYIKVECYSDDVDFGRVDIECLDVIEKNKKCVESKKEKIEKEAMTNLNKSIDELQKIKHMLKDGAYEEAMDKIRKEYEVKMNEIYNIK